LVDAIREVADGGTVFDQEVTHRLAANKTRHNAASPDPLLGLSAQELRLLAEVAQGKTDKEAAATLGLTAKTARNYLDRIFTKLGVHTRTEAAMLYARSTMRSSLSE
jgi:DNA-binding NarL/FixJ family response regulator